MEKYAILWLDDEFAGNTEFGKLVDSFETAQDEFKITRASDFREFEEYLDSHNYDGVILDIFGDMSSDQTERRNTSCPFDAALELLRTEKIVKIVYSGKVKEHPDEEDRLVRQSKRAGSFRFNKGEIGIDDLFEEKIKPLLEDKFRRDFPEYDKIKKYLSEDVKEQFDKVRCLYNGNVDKSEPFCKSDFEDIRELIEAVFMRDAIKRRLIGYHSKLGDCLEELSEKKCDNKLVKPALKVMSGLANPHSHYNEDRVVGYASYGKYVYLALCNTLFMCLKWYYCELVPTNFIEPDRQEGIVQKDDEGNIHLGDFVLPSKTEWAVGQKVRLVEPKPNTNPKTKDKYPFYAKFEPV